MKMSPWAFGYHAERLGFKPKESKVGLRAIYKEFHNEINEVRRNVMDACINDSLVFSRNPQASIVVIAEMLGGAIYNASKEEHDFGLDFEHIEAMLDMSREIVLNTMLAMRAKEDERKKNAS